MGQLAEQVATLTHLIQSGQTLAAMERFYADDVTMQENENLPRVGKAVCLNHERQMLSGTIDFKATLICQAINESINVVFSEWVYAFTELSGQRFSLREVSVQQWQNELIQSEKFYYNKISRVEQDNLDQR